MSFRKQLLLICALLILCVAPIASYAQPDNDPCPIIVQTALDTVDRYCSDTQRNIACYGNLLINATPRPDVVDFTFEQPGDIVDVVKLEALQLETMNIVNQTWGVAVLKLQANLPDTLPGQNVTFLLLGDVTLSNAVDPEDITQTPMQAIYLSTGIGDRRCNEAPDSGILIQTPEGVETVDLNINGVDIALGSTAFLQSSTEHMDLFLLEHEAAARVGDVTQVVPAGTFVRIPLDEDGLASGPPGYPEPYDRSLLEALPTSHLPRDVEIPSPLSKEEIDAALGSGATPALIYTVQAGDTMYSIARCFGTTYPIIAEANYIADPSVIYRGQDLIVPTDAGTVPAQRSNRSCPQTRPVATNVAPGVGKEATPEATPICDLNWCFEGGPWDDGRCNEDAYWEAGWFRACYEAGLIDAIPSSIVDPPVPGQIVAPAQRPFDASIACVAGAVGQGLVRINYSNVLPGDALSYNVPGCNEVGSVIAPRTSGAITLYYCFNTGTGWIQNPTGYVVPLPDISC